MHDLLGFDLGDRPRLYPFREFVDGDKKMGVAPTRLLKGPNQI
jgi:hypothetical protein